MKAPRIRRVRPFESRGRWIVLAILSTFVLLAAVSLALTLTAKGQAQDPGNVNSLLDTQLWLSVGGLVASLLLGAALIATSRRQTAHFKTLAQSSTDLLALIDESGCRYVSPSLIAKVGRSEEKLLGEGLSELVHEDDMPLLARIASTAQPATVAFRLRDAAGEWRHLDAHVADLRANRHMRGVVINARDTTERVRLEQQLTRQAESDGFVSRLSEALEMADEELAVCDIVERAMAEISEATPMELLLSDSSRANLRSVAESPSAGAPGCGVQSPFSCVAVRRGSAVVFDSSEELNACPHLRERPEGACSAVCVPVGFMGRSLGVLHTTGPDQEPLKGESVSRIGALAAQAGSRIGTVRAFEKTQLQASTDGLTGLVNRRTAETRLREMIKEGSLFSVILADLDHFKQLNDTHGHEAGDRALRLFATVAEETFRDHDIISRWGGEEFIIVLPELDRFQAVTVIDRLRLALSRAHPGETARFTASFGIADSNQSDVVETLVQIADLGLYASKQAGRDRATIGEADGPTPPPRTASARSGPRKKRSPIQEASYEEDPAPSGVEIRWSFVRAGPRPLRATGPAGGGTRSARRPPRPGPRPGRRRSGHRGNGEALPVAPAGRSVRPPGARPRRPFRRVPPRPVRRSARHAPAAGAGRPSRRRPVRSHCARESPVARRRRSRRPRRGASSRRALPAAR